MTALRLWPSTLDDRRLAETTNRRPRSLALVVLAAGMGKRESVTPRYCTLAAALRYGTLAAGRGPPRCRRVATAPTTCGGDRSNRHSAAALVEQSSSAPVVQVAAHRPLDDVS
jgi:hypothetical protein